ncbi:MAG: hypothetical protein JNN06_01885 [Gemmobacter sp.]|uniref:hypothetical protein n=1 Tax=Gemmobacter sp. TaxID=1898957 RepID=UPI001A511BD0|nr:hypothetical protein [Gemmobacter sp.]MBL8561006.1 hypothetical protein [Gemmobacter sp.]
MLKQAMIYCAAFLAAFALYSLIMLIVAINPNQSWRNPHLEPFIDMIAPGRSRFVMYLLKHAVETSLPFVLAYWVARRLTGGKARASGAMILYAVFLVWSGWIGLQIKTSESLLYMFLVGLAGTFFGGFGLYMTLVAPRRA